MNKERQQAAADLIEELDAPLKEIIRRLRQVQSDALAYALVYEWRKRFGYIVRTLGEGVPSVRAQQEASEIIESEEWKHAVKPRTE